MIVRQITAADSPAIAELEVEIARISFPENPIDDPAAHRKKLRKAMEKEPDGMFVAEVEGRIIGWLWITTNTSFATGERYATLRSLAVSPEWRGKGIGRSLAAFAIDHCRQRGARWISGKVHVDNAPMRALFHSAGFRAKHLTMEYRLEDNQDGAQSSAM
ncbi:MAG: GNAT family N-acetyltransferase [Anaerolineae bacterium]|jgi:ribosomal protein S18 acetylase RimI-like enzyme|nr:GNAT family N-acetyltransferase [Anaerolineae bacterium]